MQGGGFLLGSIDMEYKVCSTCKIRKPLEEFKRVNKRKYGYKDGYEYRCKNCESLRRSSYRKNHRTEEAQRDREYRKTEKGKLVHRKSSMIYYKNHPGVVKESHRIHSKKYGLRHPERIKARNAIANEVRRGRIPSPSTQQCVICKVRQAKHYHHHKGYEKIHWLDVIPVCNKCHNSIHAE